MSESSVHHHLYGCGEIRETRYKGLELRVEFADGIARWVRVEDLVDAPAPQSVTESGAEKRIIVSEGAFKSRRMAEAFRMGIVPYDTLDGFTFGREKEIRFLADWLEDPLQSTLIVLGEYGTGKSHILHYAQRYALRSGFAVSHLAVDPLESPFSKPKRVYSRLMQSFRYPVCPEGGTGSFRDFISACIEKGSFSDHHYFGPAARGFWDDSWWEWISGAQLSSYPWKAGIKAFMSKVPGLYDYSSAANIYCYLLSSLGWAAKEVMGLKGLLLTFDEAEAVDLYEHSYQPAQSRNFLSALIRAAENEEALAGSPHTTGLRYCKMGKGAAVPFAYRLPSSLKLIFSFTPGYTMSTLLELQTPPLMELESLNDAALKSVYEGLCGIYELAYDFKADQIDYGLIRDLKATAEGRTRRFVKATIEAHDLARFNPKLTLPEILANELLPVSNIRELLRHSWVPFFGSFGRLKQPQIEAIPKILAGENVVISAPTASGKTEAVVAPVAERMVTEQWSGLSVIYITPTRALGNDISARIQGSLREMGVSARLKHGDTPPIPIDNIPNFLITTPESLDSILCRRTEILKDLRVLILDEVHLVDNTYRGDQLRILIRRLRQVATDPNFSVHVLSATLGDPYDIGSRYSSAYEVVSVSGHRSIDLLMVKSVEEVYSLARERHFNKILCFCNLRENVEKRTDEMRKLWHPYPVVPHHGNLGVSLRNEAERVMREESVAVCVATSTLEIGIDIGDIDLILLADVPWSLSSFVQRIGRGKRRGDRINVAGMIGSEDGEWLFRALAEDAEAGEIGSDPYEPDISVAVQQIFSLLFQRKQGATEEDLLDLLGPLGTADDLKLVLNHLRNEGWLELRGERWAASARLMDFAEKPKIHANIPSSEMLRVVDVESGSEIGEIDRRFDQFFVLGGRTWQAVWSDDKVVKVRRLSGSHPPAKFKRSRPVGAFFFFLPEELQIWPDDEFA